MKPKETIAQRMARATEELAVATKAVEETRTAYDEAVHRYNAIEAVVDAINAATTGKQLEEAFRAVPDSFVESIPTFPPAQAMESAGAKVRKASRAKRTPKKLAAKTKEIEQLAKLAKTPEPEEAPPCDEELAMLKSANDLGVVQQLTPPWVRRQLQRQGMIEEAREGTGERKRFYRLTEAGRKLIGWAPVLTPLAVNDSVTPPARDYPAKKTKPADDDEMETDRELVLGPFALCSPKAELGESIEYVLREAGFADKPLQTVVDAFNGANLVTLADIRDAVEAEKTDAREYFRPAFARVCIQYGLDRLWESIERGIRKYLKDLYSA
jgi:DNA-binding MarR family transcriptional regulator